jgi:predicted dehydrogenase
MASPSQLTSRAPAMRLGVIGLGRWGTQLADTAVALGSSIEACYAPSEESRDAFAERFDCTRSRTVDEVLENPNVDGVVIASPNATHADIVCGAASAKKHILVEKPLALSLEDALRAVTAAEESGVVLQTGHSRRRVGAMRELKRLQEAGLIGDVLQAESTTSRPTSEIDWFKGWRHDPRQAPLGGMTAIGVHLVDNLHYLLGPSISVFARSTNRTDGRALDDATSLLVEYASGAMAYLGISLRVAASFKIELKGTRGSAWTVDPRTAGAGTSSEAWFQGLDDATGRRMPVEPIDPVVEQYLEFAHCCRNGKRPETDGRAGLAVVAVMEAALNSVHSGEIVPVRDVGQWAVG